MMKKTLSAKAARVQPSATLTIDAKFKQMKDDGMDVVGFGAGEPDFDTPDFIKEAAVQALKDGHTKYTPASGLLKLRTAICEKLEKDNKITYKPSQIVVSNGAKHALYNALVVLCNPGDEVILSAPYWVSYYELIQMADATPVVLQTTQAAQFKISEKDLEAVITDKTKAIILNSPSNPTGMIYTKEELEKIARICEKHNIYVISDEIYEKLIYDDEEHVSIASLGDKIKELTIVINGVSKSYAMTGWRIGYTASNQEIATAMANYQSHAASNPNTIAQHATLAALEGPQDEVERMRQAFSVRRDHMVEKLNAIDGVSCTKPNGAFYVMMNIEKLLGKELYGKTIVNADDFCTTFLEVAGVALVPCTAFGAPTHVRWSYATSRANIDEGLSRLEKFIHNQYSK